MNPNTGNWTHARRFLEVKQFLHREGIAYEHRQELAGWIAQQNWQEVVETEDYGRATQLLHDFVSMWKQSDNYFRRDPENPGLEDGLMMKYGYNPLAFVQLMFQMLQFEQEVINRDAEKMRWKQVPDSLLRILPQLGSQLEGQFLSIEMRNIESNLESKLQHIHESIQALAEIQKDLINNILDTWNEIQTIRVIGDSDRRAILMEYQTIVGKLEYLHMVNLGDLMMLQHLPNALNMSVQVREQLAILIAQTVIFEIEPPKVVKAKAKVNFKIRILTGKVSKRFAYPAQITCGLLTEGEALQVQRSGEIRSHEDNLLETNQFPIQYDGELGYYCEIQTQIENPRKHGKTDRKVPVGDQKYCLHCFTILQDGTNMNTIQLLSLPFGIVVNVSQQGKTEATIFWDHNFSGFRERLPFQVPDHTNWGSMTEALQRWFHERSHRLVSESQMQYLHDLIPKKDELISWDGFATEQMKSGNRQLPHSFWGWVHGTMDFVRRREHKNLQEFWELGYLEGFISKAKATELLKDAEPGTFLLRFSESVPGGISVVCVGYNAGEHRSKMLLFDPWFSDDLKMKCLANRILQLPELQYLYPGIPKQLIFEEFRVKEEPVAPAVEVESDYPFASELHIMAQGKVEGDHHGLAAPLTPMSQQQYDRMIAAGSLTS